MVSQNLTQLIRDQLTNCCDIMLSGLADKWENVFSWQLTAFFNGFCQVSLSNRTPRPLLNDNRPTIQRFDIISSGLADLSEKVSSETVFNGYLTTPVF